jgi:hypothetical protein
MANSDASAGVPRKELPDRQIERWYRAILGWRTPVGLALGVVLMAAGFCIYFHATATCDAVRGKVQLAATNDRLSRLANADSCAQGVDGWSMFVGDLILIVGYWMACTIILLAGWWRYDAPLLRKAWPVVLLPSLVAVLDVLEDITLFFNTHTSGRPTFKSEGVATWWLLWVSWSKWLGIVAMAIAVVLALAVWWSRRNDSPALPMCPAMLAKLANDQRQRDDSRYQGVDIPRPEDDEEAVALDNAGNPSAIGICVSGGGIRSTAFSLGVLGELEKLPGIGGAAVADQPDPAASTARYVAAVSGGAWAATAWTLQRAFNRGSDSAETAADTLKTALLHGQGISGFQRQKYLLNGPAGIMWALMWVLLCSAINILLVGLLIFVVAWPLGWFMGTSVIRPDLREGMENNPMPDPTVLYHPGLVFAVLGLVLLLVCGFGGRNLARQWPFSVVLLALSVFSFGYLIVLPAFFRRISELDDYSSAPSVAVVATIITSLAASVGVSIFRLVAEPLVRLLAGPISRLFGKLFALILAAGVLAWAVFIMYFSARQYQRHDNLSLLSNWCSVVIAAVAILLMFYGLSPNWPSLHNIFSKRLGRSFDPVAMPLTVGAASNPAPTWTELASKSKPNNESGVPELILCCAQQRNGIASGGLRAETFTISPNWVRQGRRSIPRDKYLSATVAVNGAPFRLRRNEFRKLAEVAPWMATTGAAVSSAMGRLSKGSLNALLAIINADLGLWLPNMRVIQEECAQPTGPKGEDNKQRWRRRLPRPRFDYTLKEILGWYSTEDRFVFVTDGGHWDNLGIVELLRRKCTEIYCIDASGDPPGSFTALREAFALESLELGQLERAPDYATDLKDMLPTEDAPPNSPVASFTLTRREDRAKVTVHYAKLQATREMPTELRRYAVADPDFPHYSTMRQFLTYQRFLSLYEFGQYVGAKLADEATKSLMNKNAAATPDS